METIVLEAGQTEKHYWRDLFRYRELFFFLAWRDISVRFKQTVVGVLWVLLKPFLAVVVFTLVFEKFAGMSSHDAPYPVFVLAALLPWQLFANAFANSSSSLVANSALIKKVYFPRMIIPASSMIVGLVEFGFAFLMLFVLMAWYQFLPPLRILSLPLFLLLALMAALGPALWIGALNVRYRDFSQITPFIVQFGLYLSPVGYMTDVVPGPWRTLYALNPMVGVIDGFRWAILGGEFTLDPTRLGISFGVAAILLITGLWFFRSTEKTFADII